MSKKLQVIYSLVLIVIAAGALIWYVRQNTGAPELADGTVLVPFTGQYPANWPAGLKVVQGEGVWAGNLNQVTPSGKLQNHVVARFYVEAPVDEVVAELDVLLKANYGFAATIDLTQGDVPVRGFSVLPGSADPPETGYSSATVTASPVTAGLLRKNPRQRIETVVTIQRLVPVGSAQ